MIRICSLVGNDWKGKGSLRRKQFDRNDRGIGKPNQRKIER